MKIGKSSNPALSRKSFQNMPAAFADSGEVMTVSGTVNKSIMMLLLVFLGAAISWRAVAANPGMVTTMMIGGGIGGFVLAMITIFKKEWAHITAPIYALVEGLFLGAISLFIESIFPGIAFQAVGLTFAVAISMLLAYKAGWIRATAKFKSGIIAATGGIALFYILNIVFGAFGMGVSLGSLGLLGIGIQVFIVAIAALNLILDFDFIEQGAAANAPKQMEWYAAFGLMVTLVWLYLEILRLLALLAGRD